MRRSFLLFVKAGLLVAAAVWIAANPGRVNIVWGDWVVETSAGIAVIMALVLAGLIALVFAIRPAIRWFLGRDRERRAVRRRAAAYTALTGGMVAIAAGDARRAAREIAKLDKAIDDKTYVHLLSGQAAQLRGDEPAVVAAFGELVEEDGAKFLGQRGLITTALRSGLSENLEVALELSLDAFRQHPRSPWILNTLGDIYCRMGNWAAAQALLEGALKRGLLPAGDAARQLAAILEVRADAAEGRGEIGQARSLAKRAHNLDPQLTPATIRLARLELAAKHRRRARHLIEKVWSENSGVHRAIADIYVEAAGATDPIARFRALEGLHALNPDSRESALILAESAIDAGLSGNARAQLEVLEKERSSARLVQLMARLAVAESDGDEDTTFWLDRIAAAAPDPGWICGQCGATSTHWQAGCRACHSTGRIHWSDQRDHGAAEYDLLDTSNKDRVVLGDRAIAPAANSS